MKAYFDESFDDQVFLMCGWVGAPDEWDRFAICWDDILKSTPRIEYFKHYEATSFERQFEGWSETDRDAKLAALAEVVNKHDLYPVVGYCVSQLKFQKDLLSRRKAPLKVVHKTAGTIHPYRWCFSGVIARTLHEEIDCNRTGPVDFVFDGNGLFDECLKEFIEHHKPRLPDEMRSLVGTVTMEPDERTVLPLQASDMLAGQVLYKQRGKKPELHFKRRACMKPCIPPDAEDYIEILKYVDDYWFSKKEGRDRF